MARELKTCGNCGGSGECQYCRGTGHNENTDTRCARCGGSGGCAVCEGSGEIEVES